jgi:hypothetical protein
MELSVEEDKYYSPEAQKLNEIFNSIYASNRLLTQEEFDKLNEVICKLEYEYREKHNLC